MITATIVNQKGGVCKTTIARNLGYSFAVTYGKRVLLIDLDSSANLTDIFGLRQPAGSLRGAAQVLLDTESDPMENIFETSEKGLFLMPGNEMLAVVENKIKADVACPQQIRLRYQLEKIADQFDFCFIDCPPTVQDNIHVINALVCSDDVIIPCVPDVHSVRGAAIVVGIVNNTIRKWYNPKLSIRGIVFCRIENMNFDKQLLQQKLAIPRFRTVIRENKKAAKSVGATGESFHEYNPNSHAAIDMDNLAAEYLGVAFPHPDELPEELPEF